MPDQPRFLASGDTALTVEFGSDIDERVNARVLALDARLQDAALPGVVETVPTYRSLLVHYDPVATDAATLRALVLELCHGLPEQAPEGRLWRVPVVYGGEFGVDLEATAERHGVTSDTLIERHTAPTYRVYMLGFLPGLAYLGGLDPALATPRRETPRLTTPAGTISIGGVQALIATVPHPSGWHLLGRTPVRNFQPGREPPVLIGPGDRVRFEPVPASSWDALDRAAAAGEAVAEVIAG